MYDKILVELEGRDKNLYSEIFSIEEDMFSSLGEVQRDLMYYDSKWGVEFRVCDLKIKHLNNMFFDIAGDIKRDLKEKFEDDYEDINKEFYLSFYKDKLNKFFDNFKNLKEEEREKEIVEVKEKMIEILEEN